MKKFITLIFAFVMSMAAFAQSEHMKFMGIPLDGTISDFQSKLLAKGATQNSRLSAQYPVGTRVFNGSFSGIKSEFYVYYDKKTKNVYRAKACIDEKNKKRLEERYKEVKELIKGKYKGIEKTDEFEGHESYSVEKNIGIVQIYTSEEIENNQRIYVVHVDYTDWENSSKYDDSQSDEENGGSITDENANSYSNKMDQEEVLLDKINKALQQKNAQHMKFMGIPLDGTINAFQSKLAAKGIIPNVSENKNISVGCRAFKGIFAGYKAYIYVYYDEKTKIVYSAKVCISIMDEGILEQRYQEFKRLIKSKYYDDEIYARENIGSQNEHELYAIVLEDLGTVGLFVSSEMYVTEYTLHKYTLHICYSDLKNSKRHSVSQLDDI